MCPRGKGWGKSGSAGSGVPRAQIQMNACCNADTLREVYCFRSDQIGVDDGAQHDLGFIIALAIREPPQAGLLDAPWRFVASKQQARHQAERRLMADNDNRVGTAIRPACRREYSRGVGAGRDVAHGFEFALQCGRGFLCAQGWTDQHDGIVIETLAQPLADAFGLLVATLGEAPLEIGGMVIEHPIGQVFSIGVSPEDQVHCMGTGVQNKNEQGVERISASSQA